MKLQTKLLIATFSAVISFNAVADNRGINNKSNICRTDVKFCKIGDIGPGGGTVFYKAPTKQPWGQYLEFAPTSWYGVTVDPEVVWCSNTTTIIPSPLDGTTLTTSTSTEIGAGWANTQIMMNTGCTWGSANIVKNYIGGGKTDWFLPSQDELNAMHSYFEDTGLGGFTNANYWSSSEQAHGTAWGQGFYINGQQNNVPKVYAYLLRPIRAF